MTTPHLLGRPANLAKCLHRTRAAGGKVWSSEYSSLLKWSIIHTHWKPFFFFFHATRRLLQSCTEEVQHSHKTICTATSLQWASDSFTSEAKPTPKFPTTVSAMCLLLWQLLNATRVTIAYAGRTPDVFPQWWVRFS